MSDIEIAHSVKMKEIKKIGKKLGISDYLEYYGDYKAKIEYDKITKKKSDTKLILVTATSPTPFGEGKTTVSIGLLDALCKMKLNAIAALREPSQGPVFGIKGGATGGGHSQVLPMEDINLNFTGDFHAITGANNLLCAAIDNHIHQGNSLNLDENRILFNRCLDVNDRALKDITIHGKEYERKEAFDITAASEMMAIVCLTQSMEDLRRRLDNILIGYDKKGKPVFAKSLNISGSLMVILKDAIKPNLVQTLEHNPVIIHGGPFANIAHGCNTVIATKTAMNLADYVVTEAGFGSDLGALKFYDIKCRYNGLKPDVTVLVTTIKAIKYNGNDNIEEGICNLGAHIDILKNMTNNIVVCLNKYDTDTNKDINYVKKYVASKGVKFAMSTAYVDGGKGAIKLAKEVLSFDNKEKYKELYDINDKVENKIEKIVKGIYHAKNITYSDIAKEKLELFKKNGLDKLPICVAKTQYSISDNPKVLGNPVDYDVQVRDVKLYNGAGILTIYLGSIITMPGLPKKPNYEIIDIVDNEIVGLS